MRAADGGRDSTLLRLPRSLSGGSVEGGARLAKILSHRCLRDRRSMTSLRQYVGRSREARIFVLLVPALVASCGENAPSSNSAQDRGTAALRIVHADGHCGQESVRRISIGPDPRTATHYIADPERELPAEEFAGRMFDDDVALPSDAQDVGTTEDGRDVLSSPDGEFLYVADGDTFEQWPRAPHPFACE